MYDCSELVFRHQSVTVKRRRNYSIETCSRPDLVWMLKGALLFKGEDRANGSDMRLALHDLLSKMKDWSINYHGKVVCTSRLAHPLRARYNVFGVYAAWRSKYMLPAHICVLISQH
jgi:hypothetical protein